MRLVGEGLVREGSKRPGRGAGGGAGGRDLGGVVAASPSAATARPLFNARLACRRLLLV